MKKSKPKNLTLAEVKASLLFGIEYDVKVKWSHNPTDGEPFNETGEYDPHSAERITGKMVNEAGISPFTIPDDAIALEIRIDDEVVYTSPKPWPAGSIGKSVVLEESDVRCLIELAEIAWLEGQGSHEAYEVVRRAALAVGIELEPNWPG